MNKEELAQFLRDDMDLVVEKHEVYNGGINGGSMYDIKVTLKLMLSGEVISEQDLDLD